MSECDSTYDRDGSKRIWVPKSREAWELEYAQRRVVFERLNELAELVHKRIFPFNKDVFLAVEVIRYCGFEDIKIDKMREMLNAVGCKDLYSLNREMYELVNKLNGETYAFFIHPIAEPFEDAFDVLEAWHSATPEVMPKPLWQVAREEYDKLSKEDQAEYRQYLANPKAFWLHPKRWEGDMDGPFFMKELNEATALLTER